MKRIIVILFAMAVSCTLRANYIVTGKVVCEGVAVRQVSVSDGDTVVLTDERGEYSINTSNRNGYVFMSVPAGYWVDVTGTTPNFFIRLNTDSIGKYKLADFQIKKMPDGPYHFYVTTDMHLTNTQKLKDLSKYREWFLPDLRNEVNRRKGFGFALILGDMTTDVKWYSNSYALPEYMKTIKDYPLPAFHVMGNHDNDQKGEATPASWDSLAQAAFIKNIGPNYYSFNVGKVHYVVLDNIMVLGPEGKGTKVGKNYFKYMLDQKQLKWFKMDMALVDHKRPVVIALHVPVFKCEGLKDGVPEIVLQAKENESLLDVLKEYSQVHILSGHTHITSTMQYSGQLIEHNLASLSAVSWMLYDYDRQLCPDGSWGGYQIFSVNKDLLEWEYKAVGKTVEESQFRAYDLNVVPTEFGGLPGENKLLVNVINWDPAWKVEFFENGVPLAISQVAGSDPLYAYIRENTQSLPTRPTAFRAAKTIHLFKGQAKSPSSIIELKVTDRFGKIYKQTMMRPKAFTWDID